MIIMPMSTSSGPSRCELNNCKCTCHDRPVSAWAVLLVVLGFLNVAALCLGILNGCDSTLFPIKKEIDRWEIIVPGYRIGYRIGEFLGGPIR